MENLAAQTPPASHIEQGGPGRRDTDRVLWVGTQTQDLAIPLDAFVGEFPGLTGCIAFSHTLEEIPGAARICPV
jgi:hypothetical protein